MKISLNWIKKFVDIPKKLSARQLAELLTLRTCEVEGWEDQSEKFKNMVIGEIKRIRTHPNADKLKLCDTDIGGALVQIVCGGANIQEGMLVPVALPGAMVDWHGKGEMVALKETEVRGQKSYGMICAGEEVGLGACPTGEITDLSKLSVVPGTPLGNTLYLDDVIFEIDNKSLTHRPDLWGHYGMAREFAAFLSQKLRSYEKSAGIDQIKFPKKGVEIKVDIQSEKISPRFCAVIMSGLKVEESPEWLKAQLAACGVRSVNNIVDVTNFVMLELGQPMHAFDRNVVSTDHFEVRYAKDGEILETLDHKKRALTKEDAVISNGRELLALAGIMGGVKSEISLGTTEIILEAANWNPVMVRKTSQRFGLRSEASQRYEKSLDPKLADLAIKRACRLLLSLCSTAKIAGPMTDVKLAAQKVITVKLALAKVISKIGVSITPKDIKRYLETLGFAVKMAGKEVVVAVPTYRATKDVSIEDDLVEEIARMYGYEKIPALLPELPIKLPRENLERKLKHWARDILSLSLGFTEANHYSFYNEADFRKCLLPKEPHFKIVNPLSEDQTHLRTNLVPNVLKSVVKNEREFSMIKIYEIGRQYRKKEGSYFPQEEKYICGAVVGKDARKKPIFIDPAGNLMAYKLEKAQEVFYDAKGAVETFLRLVPAEHVSFEESKEPPPYAHPKKCADIIIHNEKAKILLGHVFELHPLVGQNWDIRGKVAIFEINFSLLASLPLRETAYTPIAKFPGIDIDVSIVVARKAQSFDVITLIKKADQELIKSISLLDIFEDHTIGEGKKSLTYRIRFEAKDRTLTDEEMHTVQQRIFQNLEGAGYTIRK